MTTQQQASDDVTATVADFITRGETFTAAHVTMAVRANQLWAGTLGHERGVAPLVRGVYDKGDMDGYSQSMVNGTFYAYHPIGQDPASVDLRIAGGGWLPRVDRASFGQGADAPPAGATPNAPNRGAVPLARVFYNGGKAAADGDVVRVEYNAQGNAQLPKAMTTALGLNPGDGVAVAGRQLAGTCTLTAADDGDEVVARLQPVNGSLRIRDRVLMPFGVGLHDDVTIRLDLANKSLILT